MEKKVWKRPCVVGQLFEPNEYVASCYRLACVVGPGTNDSSNGDYWNGREYGGVNHAVAGTSGTCADPSANRVVTDSGLLADSHVGEYNNEQGWITGAIDSWLDINNNKKVDAGDIIYWHTFSSNKDRRWNHYGTLQLADSAHPNHS